MPNYRQQISGSLLASTVCPSCPPPFIPCSSAESSGGVGITDYSASLSSGGGLLAFLFNPQGVPDKLEIMHGAAAGTKKATTGMNATDNYGPFDNVYGTETANTVPTASQTLSIQQFIGTDKGAAATRLTEFTTETGYEVPSLTIGGVTYQQVVWWTYSNADYLADSTATIRVTGATGTGWNLIRLCCPDGNCVVPAATLTPFFATSGTSPLNDGRCGYLCDTLLYHNGTGTLPQTGDIIYAGSTTGSQTVTWTDYRGFGTFDGANASTTGIVNGSGVIQTIYLCP